MPLPFLPMLDPDFDPRTEDRNAILALQGNIQKLYEYFQNFIDDFSTSVNEVQTENSDTEVISLTGTGGDVEIKSQLFTVTHNLNKLVAPVISLDNRVNESSTARFISWDVLDNTLDAFSVRVNGIFIASSVTITATAVVFY